MAGERKSEVINNGITRRTFLTGAGAVIATGTLAACTSKTLTETVTKTETPLGTTIVTTQTVEVPKKWSFETPPDPIADSDIKETINTDVVVLGASNAGLMATAAAAEAGADTVLLQKTAAISGSGGYMGMVGSRLQKTLNKNVDKQAIIADVCQWSACKNDQSVVKLWADRSGEVMDWLMDIIEKEYENATVMLEWDTKDGFYKAYPISHQIVAKDPSAPRGAVPGVREIVLAKAEEYGVDIRYSTPAVQLIRQDNGRVTGVIAKNEGGDYLRFNASKGVIICTGGYSQNIEMLEAYCPRALWSSEDVPMTQGVTGDGIKMALWIGADIDELPHAPMQFDLGVPVKGIGYPWTGKGGNPGIQNMLRQPFLRVNLNGERYINEDQPYQYNCNAAFQQPGKMWWSVWDANWREHVRENHTTGCARILPSPGGTYAGNLWDLPAYQNEALDSMQAAFEGMMELGTVVKADTIEELAQKMGVSVATFKATVTRYTELAKQGQDLDFGKLPFRFKPIEKPPFYAEKGAASLLTTISGLRINKNLQVLDKNHLPIEGLYAAGDVSGSFFANDYPELEVGIALGRTLTFGRLAGQNAAANP